MIEHIKIDWYRTPIDRDRLRELTARSNWKPLLHVVAQLALSAATAYVAFYSFRNWPWPVTVLLVWVHCTFYTFFGYAGGAHELSHRNVFRSSWLNGMVIFVYGLLTWGNYVHFRHSHMKHHQLTVHHNHDYEVILPHIVPARRWFWIITINIPSFLRTVAMTLRQATGRLKGDWEEFIFPEHDAKARRKLFWLARGILAFHLGVVAYSILSGNWIFIFLVTLGVFTGQWLNLLAGLPQHVGMQADVPDWRLSCRTFIPGPLVRFLYWNMNYHVEHHMYASVPFYNLPKLHREIAWDTPEPGRGLIRFWRSEMSPAIRMQRDDPEWTKTIVFPGTANPPVRYGSLDSAGPNS
jgi:fatty acid desaturase